MITQSRVGITDWPQKQSFLRALYGVLNNKALVEQVIGANFNRKSDELLGEVEKCYETFRRWDRSKPSNKRSQQFWEQVIKDNEIDAGPATLWAATIGEFLGFFTEAENFHQVVYEFVNDQRSSLDPSTKQKLELKFGRGSTAREEVETTASLKDYNLRAHTGLTFAGPQTGVKEGHIQSTMFYNMPEAATAWAALVESKNYKMYLECLLSLKCLVSSEQWKTALNHERFVYDTAVTLGGGGSPEKDWVIITSMLESLGPTRALQYWINDISPYMIQNSVRSLHRRLDTSNLDKRININLDWSDFLRLDMHFKLPPSNGVLWALLGGTIGNVSERDLFRSINGPSKIGDLLVIGFDSIDNETSSAFEDRMNAEYQCKELDALLQTQFVIASAGGKKVVPKVDVMVEYYREQRSNNFSNVPDSRTAVFFSSQESANDSRVVLAYSTRYTSVAFISFARQFGWECLTLVDGPSGSRFRQLLLRRFR